MSYSSLSYNHFEEIPPIYEGLNDLNNVFIIHENSFMNCPNFDIDKIKSGNITPYEIELLKNSEIKTICTFNEFMSIKNCKKIHILLEENFHRILSKIGIQKKYQSNIYILYQPNGENILYFSNEFKFIKIKNKNNDINEQFIQDELIQNLNKVNNYFNFCFRKLIHQIQI